MKQKKNIQHPGLRVKRGRYGLGLYAMEPINKGSFIIEYVGPLLTEDQTRKRRGKYLFSLGKIWTIDGSGRSNIARYINHACVKTNCEPIQYALRIRFRATRNIKAGEELFYDYGKEYYNEFIKGHCRCAKHAQKK